MKQRDLTRNAQESEKEIERYLSALAHMHGAISLKYTSGTSTGFPDRLLLFAQGVAVWVEVKSKGRMPTRLQLFQIGRLRRLGHMAFICDSRETAEEIVGKALREVDRRERRVAP
ncbi:MAG: VRR-NUC domain-containing protein [Bacteroides sp.]|nr:VRR-NUC domain-containing protein [Bacteroides sp.]